MVPLSLCAPRWPDNLPGPQCGQSLTLGQRRRSLSAVSRYYVPQLICFASLRGCFPVASGSPWSQLACIRGSKPLRKAGKPGLAGNLCTPRGANRSSATLSSGAAGCGVEEEWASIDQGPSLPEPSFSVLQAQVVLCKCSVPPIFPGDHGV